MKTGIKYGLILLSIHIVLCWIGIVYVYDPLVPNSDLGLIVFPNVIALLPVADLLPHIFGTWSILMWEGILWFLIGSIIGFVVEKRRLKKSAYAPQ